MTDTSGINSTIAANITTNGRGAITGAILASVLASGGLTAWVATQYPPHVASLAALQTFTSSYATTVIRDDYAAGNGAPPMTYKWNAICPGSPDNTALYVQPTGTSPACWSAAADPNVGDTREWGAVNDSTPTTCGAHDNQAAIQAAVNALPASIKVYNAGWSCTKSQVNVSKPGQVIACAGGLGGHHDVSNEYTGPAGFVAGASMGVMFQYKSATTSANYGNGMDCSLNGNSLAAIGIDSYSMRNGTWNVSGAHFTTSIIQADIDTGLAEIQGSTENQYRIIADQGLATDGSTFKCVGTATADCSQDNFLQISGVTSGLAYAIDMDNGDSESFFSINLYSNNLGGTKCGVRLRAGASANQAARNNLFYYLGVTNASCPVYAEGTEAGGGRNTPSNQNIIYALDTANNPALPTVGTGATLSWATIQAPVGPTAYSPHVPTNAALSVASTAIYPNGVWRDDYSTGKGAPPLWFMPETGTCVANSRINDGGSCQNAAGGNSFYAVFPGAADVREWGADNTGAVSSQTALQTFANYVCSAPNRAGYIPTGTYLYTGVSLTLAAGVSCSIRGDGPSQTILLQTGTSGIDWDVEGSGSQQFTLRDMALKESSTGHKTSGYAVKFGKLYYPGLRNVTITGYNGVFDYASATMDIDVNLSNLTGVQGLYFAGDASASLFGAVVRVTADTANSTSIVWVDMDSYAYSVTIAYGVLLHGGSCERMRDSAALGAASAPQWLFNTHLECDHNNAKAVDLVQGSGFTIAPASWVGATTASDCIVQEATFGGQTTIEGTRINGCYGRGINVLGGTDTKIIDNTITANGQAGAGPHLEEIGVASGVSNYQIKNNYISNIGDGNSSTDTYCLLQATGGSPANIEVSGNKGMSCSSGSVANLLRGTNVIYNANDNFNSGTWTPVLAGLTVAGTWTYSTQLGSYTIENGFLTVSATLQTSAVAGGPSGNFVINGLPYSVPNVTNKYSGCSIGYYGGYTLSASYTQLMAAALPNSFALGFYQGGSGQALATLPASGVGGSSALNLSCSFPLN